jgi:hypothetical protein
MQLRLVVQQRRVLLRFCWCNALRTCTARQHVPASMRCIEQSIAGAFAATIKLPAPEGPARARTATGHELEALHGAYRHCSGQTARALLRSARCCCVVSSGSGDCASVAYNVDDDTGHAARMRRLWLRNGADCGDAGRPGAARRQRELPRCQPTPPWPWGADWHRDADVRLRHGLRSNGKPCEGEQDACMQRVSVCHKSMISAWRGLLLFPAVALALPVHIVTI